jgi:hypothetical protein
MAKFELGKQIVTTDAKIEVAPTLATGKHTFQLVVEDSSGNLSAPATVTIIILDKTLPTAVVEVVGGNPGDDKPFVLDGSKSTDAKGGTIKSFRWTLIADPGTETPPILVTPPLG